MAIFIYGTANNTGKDFFTHEDRRNFFLRGYSGHDGSNYVDVWVVGNNEKGAIWLAEKSGTEKTKSEAQTLVSASVTLAQNAYDALSDDEKAARPGGRPGSITIP
tara:strand:+ start:289 stop:603 length:315 start_codon:yes stop_codon:yes gene_type:complete